MNLGELVIEIVLRTQGKEGLNKLRDEIDKTDDSTKKHAFSLDKVTGNLAKLHFAVEGVQKIYQGWHRTLTTLSDAYNDLESSERQMAGQARLTGQSLTWLQDVSKNAKNDFKLLKEQSNQFTIELSKLTTKAGQLDKTQDAIGALLDLGAARGLDAAQSLQAIGQAILGIDEGTDKLFLKNPSAIYKDWADSANTTVGKMTDMQKSQALLDALLKDGEKVRDEYAKWLDDTPGKTQQLANAKKELYQAFGALVNGALEPLLPLFISLFKYMASMPAPIRAVVGVVGLLTSTLITLHLTGMLPLIKTAIPKLITAIGSLKISMAAMAGPTGIIIALVSVLGILAFAHRDAAAATEDHVNAEIAYQTAAQQTSLIIQNMTMEQLKGLKAEVGARIREVMAAKNTLKNSLKPSLIDEAHGYIEKATDEHKQKLAEYNSELNELLAKAETINDKIEELNRKKDEKVTVKDIRDVDKQPLSGEREPYKEEPSQTRFGYIGDYQEEKENLERHQKYSLDAANEFFDRMNSKVSTWSVFWTDTVHNAMGMFANELARGEANWAKFWDNLKSMMLQKLVMVGFNALLNYALPGASSFLGIGGNNPLLGGSVSVQTSMAQSLQGEIIRLNRSVSRIAGERNVQPVIVVKGALPGQKFFVDTVRPEQVNYESRKF